MKKCFVFFLLSIAPFIANSALAEDRFILPQIQPPQIQMPDLSKTLESAYRLRLQQQQLELQRQQMRQQYELGQQQLEWEREQRQKTEEPRGKQQDINAYREELVKKIRKGYELFPDYQEVALNERLPITQTMLIVAFSGDYGPHILYYLGKTIWKAQEIAKLNAGAQAREIIKIEEIVKQLYQ